MEQQMMMQRNCHLKWPLKSIIAFSHPSRTFCWLSLFFYFFFYIFLFWIILYLQYIIRCKVDYQCTFVDDSIPMLQIGDRLVDPALMAPERKRNQLTSRNGKFFSSIYLFRYIYIYIYCMYVRCSSGCVPRSHDPITTQ